MFSLSLKRKTPLWILFFSILMIVSLYFSPIVINITTSMPLGIYIRDNTPIKRGDLIAFCLTPSEQQLGLNRGYLIHGTRCQISEPLIKKVIAIPHDNVTLTSQHIIVNGNTFDYATRLKDSKNRLLSPYPRGNYTNTQSYWVIGTASLQSWDSRYFGPIAKNQMLEKIKPLWIFD